MTDLLSNLPFGPWRGRGPVVGVLRLQGVIGSAGPLRSGLSLETLARPIEQAFALPRLAAVALAINSPGGSAVQSALVARRIRDLAEEKEVPVYAFVEDIAASGGYWLACAADEIWANPQIVGSIGVVAAGFGFQDLIAKAGVERRVHTAGTKKVILDPFRPERPEDVEKLHALQREIHAAFIAHVRARRGTRLHGTDEELFTGEFWAGTRGVGLGLVDGLGHLRPVLRAKFGDKVRLRAVGRERNWLQRRFRLDAVAEALPQAALAAIEERLAWQRFGL